MSVETDPLDDGATGAESAPGADPPRRSALTRRTLASDPGQAYLLYVPASRNAELPLVVSIHGTARNADAHARLLSAYAEIYGVVLLAPHFSASEYGDYQRLGRNGRGRRADLALNRMVAEVCALTGAPPERLHLFGFSGGAQFAHRYAMAYPHRIACAVIANAGWYTFPDPEVSFPQGIRSTRKLPGLRFDAEAFLRVRMTVLVGTEGQRRSPPRQSARLDREQGVTRLERARNWVAAMQAAGQAIGVAPQVSCEELPGRIRSFRSAVLRGGLADRVFEAMFGPPPTHPPTDGKPQR